VFSVLYLLFRSPTVAGGANSLLSRDLFGVPLGAHWLSGGGAGIATAGLHAAVFPAVLAILALVCWLSVWVARQMTAGPASAASGTSRAAGLLVKVLPYITVVIAAFAPLAAAVYLVVSVSWSVGERRVFAARSRHRLDTGPAGGDRPRGANTLGDRAQR
jgi:YidC/Oxa1 family membrane protein insertase